ncbi:MAG: DUF4242 domain-containing protein [Ignavibacteriales bacterium]|nr:MAG: DUF4242 domain-containing protein [Ignavibacteriales bacterium]
MPRYLIERTFADSNYIPLNNDGEKDRMEFINNNSECNATWLHSYVSDDRKKTFCIYEAPTPEAVRKAAGKNKLPIDKIFEVNLLDPYYFR